jgi:hypothetical protein
MKTTCAPISLATRIATYSGEYGRSGYHTPHFAGTSGAELAMPARPSTLSSSRYDE